MNKIITGVLDIRIMIMADAMQTQRESYSSTYWI